MEAMLISQLSSSGRTVISNLNFKNDAQRINRSDGIRLSPLWRPVIARF